MNCKVSADLPTPPLPTMMTLWTTGWPTGFLDAILPPPADLDDAADAAFNFGIDFLMRLQRFATHVLLRSSLPAKFDFLKIKFKLNSFIF